MNERQVEILFEELRTMMSDLKNLSTVTRRERIATAALQGLLSDAQAYGDDDVDYAEEAVAYADALIAELDKETP